MTVTGLACAASCQRLLPPSRTRPTTPVCSLSPGSLTPLQGLTKLAGPVCSPTRRQTAHGSARSSKVESPPPGQLAWAALDTKPPPTPRLYSTSPLVAPFSSLPYLHILVSRTLPIALHEFSDHRQPLIRPPFPARHGHPPSRLSRPRRQLRKRLPAPYAPPRSPALQQPPVSPRRSFASLSTRDWADSLLCVISPFPTAIVIRSSLSSNIFCSSHAPSLTAASHL